MDQKKLFFYIFKSHHQVTTQKPLTICIIKPDKPEKQVEIMKKIKEKGYEIVEHKEVTFTHDMVKEFYKHQTNSVS